MLNPVDVMDFLLFLDDLDSVRIEENQKGEDVTLDDIQHFNTGNNCLHYNLIYNNHRIVIQTYKYMNRKGDIDIVQGNIDLEPKFKNKIDKLNTQPQNYTDNHLNKAFVLYCGLWQKCSAFYWGTNNGFTCEFGPNVSISWVKGLNWTIDTENARISDIKFLINFIDAVEDLCQ